ncbi:MAG TPA: glycosyltransferase [Candidatus Paceibacterota bacterium]|nr:glycosyltransferase [Candidatus Paceibacterota bacterium]
MKIIYTGIQYSFYKKAAGLSFEHNNFYLSLKNFPGAEIKYFPFDRILEVGKKEFNEGLLEAVKEWQPDLLFVFMLTDEVSKDTLLKIRHETNTKTLAWFSDDTWRFWSYSRWWAPYFDWVVTVYDESFEWYQKLGFKNVIKSCWAANTELYKPSSVIGNQSSDTGPDVSLIGSWNKSRQRVVDAIRKAGIKVSTFGAGWGNGRIPEDEMIKFFGNSKINLGLNQPNMDYSLKSLGKLFFRRSVNRIVPDFWHFFINLKSFSMGHNLSQIKGRMFEIPACGGFLLTGYAKGLERYYEIGKEIVVYKDEKEIPELVKYYLEHEEERKKIARAGYERTIKDHTYEKRFLEIFKKIGLKYE